MGERSKWLINLIYFTYMLDTANNGQHDRAHWGCCWMPIAGKALWILGFLSLVGGFIALWRGGDFWSVSYMTWYLNAITGGVLAIGAKHARCHFSCHQK